MNSYLHCNFAFIKIIYLLILVSIVNTRVLQDIALSRYISSPVRQTAADKLHPIHCGLTITCFDYFDFSSLTPNDNICFLADFISSICCFIKNGFVKYKYLIFTSRVFNFTVCLNIYRVINTQ